jgi:predicted Zn-dependent protease
MTMLGSLSGCKSKQERAADYAGKAQAYLSEGDYKAAAEAAGKALEIRDDVSDYWLLSARVAMARQDYNGAYSAYMRAMELDRSNVEIVLAMAQFSYLSNRMEDAEKFSEQLLALAPDNLQGKILRASVAIRRGDLDLAAEMIEPLFVQYPDNPAVGMVKANLLSKQGKKREAVQLVESLIKSSPNPSVQYKFLLDTYRELDDIPNIERTYARALKYTDADQDDQIAYARLLLDEHKLAQAFQSLDKTLTSGKETAILQARIHEVLIESNYGDIPLDQVMSTAKTASAPFRTALAYYVLERGKPDLTKQMLQADVRSGKASTEANIIYAMAQAEVGQVGDALARTKTVLATDPTNPEALLLQSRIELDRGQLDLAEGDARLVMRDNPDMVRARIALARVYEKKGQDVLVDNIYRDAINDLPSSSRIIADYTAYLVGRKRFDEGIGVAKDFTKRNPLSLHGWKMLAGTCLQAKDQACVADALKGPRKAPPAGPDAP